MNIEKENEIEILELEQLVDIQGGAQDGRDRYRGFFDAQDDHD